MAFEIKHAKTITPKMLSGLKHFKQDYPMAILYIVYLGHETRYLTDGIIALPLADALTKLPNLLTSSHTLS